MYRNHDELNPVTGSCWVLVDDKTILNYVNGTKETYVLYSDTWMERQTETSALPGEVKCYSLDEIKELPSTYDFLDPFLQSMAILTALVIFYFAYRLILHPFFRIKL